MLQQKGVSKRLLEIIRFVMARHEFAKFSLVGGTALTLQLGHRISVDADFFGEQDLAYLNISSVLGELGKVQLLKKSLSIEVYSVYSIKVDFVNYAYPLIKPVLEIEGIRMASKEDIAAMKLNAIAGRGSKKDFIDLFFLLQIFSLRQIMDLYLKKYPDGSEFMVLKSLIYFDDADKETSPVMLTNVSWKEIQQTISKATDALR